MITFIIFGIVAVTALEVALCLVLLGLAAAEYLADLLVCSVVQEGRAGRDTCGARNRKPFPA